MREGMGPVLPGGHWQCKGSWDPCCQECEGIIGSGRAGEAGQRAGGRDPCCFSLNQGLSHECIGSSTGTLPACWSGAVPGICALLYTDTSRHIYRADSVGLFYNTVLPVHHVQLNLLSQILLV